MPDWPSDNEAALLGLRGKIGQWWSGAETESKFAGMLEVDGDQIKLCLSSDRPNHPFRLLSKPIAKVLGVVGGVAVTLVECMVTDENWNDRGERGFAARIVMRPQLILIGSIHADPDARYSVIGFTTNEAHKIFHVHPLKRIDPIRDVQAVTLAPDAHMSADEFRRSGFALVQLPNLNCFHAEIPAIDGSISYQFSASHSFSQEHGPSASYAPRLVLETREPVSLYRLLRHSRQSTHLLSLLSLTPNVCFDIEVMADANGLESWKVFENGKRRLSASSGLNHWQVLIRFPNHKTIFPEIWRRWFGTRKDHAISRWIFQSSLEQDYRFDINRFLNVMQCLEILTKLHTDGATMDKAEFDKFCTMVEVQAREQIKSEDLMMAARMLRQQNRPPLAKRLHALASRVDDKVLRWLLGDDLQALDLAVKARNYFTHFGDLPSAKRELVENNLGLLTCKMSALYVLLELDIIGVPTSAYLSGPNVGLPWMLQHATDRHVTSPRN